MYESPKIRLSGKAERSSVLPLSVAQERFWILSQINQDEAAAFNAVAAFELLGELDPAALDRALTAIVMRHEILRTTFPIEHGRPVQRVGPPPDHVLALRDFRSVGGRTEPASIRAALAESAAKPFRLDTGPLFRFELLRITEAHHVVGLITHHIIDDGWSSGIFLKELFGFYSQAKAGGSLSWCELPAQYADYALWQRKWLESENARAAERYWRTQLAGYETSRFPSDRAALQSIAYGGDRYDFALSPDLVRDSRNAARTERVSLFMYFLAAFSILLHRYAGQEDVTIGTTTANRTLPEVLDLIGYFVNILPLRVDLRGRPSFREALQRVRRTTLTSFANQELPFEKIAEVAGAPRVSNRSAMLSAMFSYQAEAELPNIAGLTVRRLPIEHRAALFDTSLTLTDKAGSVTGAMKYAPHLYSDGMIRALINDYSVVLHQVTADPSASVTDLKLKGCGSLSASTPLKHHGRRRAGLLHEVMEERTKQHPNKLAVIDETGAYSYRELNSRANAIALLLHALGLTAGSRVGLLLAGGVSAASAILATLKASLTYVPLDPSYPPERLSFIARDAGAACVLTEQRHLGLARQLAGGISIVEAPHHSTDPNVVNLPPLHRSDACAYILYTSGSTGRPKGVLQSHSNVLNLITTYCENLRITPSDTLCRVASYSFDASVMDLYGALLSGATLYDVNIRTGGLSPLIEALEAGRITVFHCTPTLFRLVVGQRKSGQAIKGVRLVVLGGEEVRGNDIELFRSHFGPDCTLVNGFGPTECTIALQHFVEPEREWESVTIPIGLPVAGSRCMLLDDSGKRAGVFGEIGIATANVALGYWGDPALTAQRFVPDPDCPGGRIYLTGDLGRLLPNGSIAFAGRKDRQSKIRGHRVEPATVESALQRLGGVKLAAAVVGRDQWQEPVLLAYVTPEMGVSLEPLHLRQQLQQVLPAHEIPAKVIILAAMPMTPTGKVDRAALPPPTWDEPAGELDEAIDPMEEILRGIWSTVLGRDRVGRDENFFEIGGHSLLAMQLVTRIEQVFDSGLTLPDLFKSPSIAGIARALASKRRTVCRSLPRRQDHVDPIPLSAPQQHMWLLEQLSPGNAGYHIGHAAMLDGVLDEDALQRAIDGLLERHEALRTVYRMAGDEPVQVVLPHAKERSHIEKLLLEGVPLAEAEVRLRVEFRRPFDLEAGPMFRVVLVRLSEHEHALLVVMHHISGDAWTSRLVMHELALRYTAAASGQTPSFAPLPFDYRHFALWQREYLATPSARESLAYWSDQLRDAPADCVPPFRRAAPQDRKFQAAVRTAVYDRSILTSVKGFCASAQTTPFIALLACWKALMFRYVRQERIVIGSPISGRDAREFETIVGCFVNTLVLKTNLAGHLTFTEALDRVQETVIAGATHQDFPFEELARRLHPKRNADRMPFFQIGFSMQMEGAPTPRFADLRVRPIPLESDRTRLELDVRVSLSESGLMVVARFDKDVYEAMDIEDLLAGFGQVITEAVNAPHTRISDLPVMTEATRSQLMIWGSGQDQARADTSVVERFTDQVRSRPSAVAISSGSSRLTYSELDERSEAIAQGLIAVGAAPNQRVAVCLERSIELVEVLLAVAKSGSAYVPLDPTHPDERLLRQLAAADAACVITSAASAARFSDAIRTLNVNALERAGASVCGRRERSVHPRHLAYVIFTSGSTGIPKGVMIEHGALMSFLRSIRDETRFGAGDHMLAMTTIAFDIAGLEIWLPLTEGGCVDLAPVGDIFDPQTVAEYINTSAAKFVQATPAAWRLLIESGLETKEGLCIFCGGERLDRDLAKGLAALAARAWNLYGPTETTIWSTSSLLVPSDEAVTIGVPLANTQVLILGDNLELVPPSVIGELYIAGAGVARGYIGQPALTAERFLPNPLGKQGERMYRTGDLARWNRDGRIEYVGRCDDQIKIRGHRIELAEIETAVLEHPAISQAAVVSREGSPGNIDLICFIVTSGEAPTERELHAHLRDRLPMYMIPKRVVTLRELPMTSNQKVDRKALSSHPLSDSPIGALARPRTELEQQVAAVWSEMLGRQDLAVTDHFFEAGGNSLLLIRVQRRLVELGYRISVVDLLKYPTIAALAAFLRGLKAAALDRPNIGTATPGRLAARRHRMTGHH